MNALHLFSHLATSLDPVEAATNSYRNFHARGLDYVCLLRSPRLTVKLYTAEVGAITPNAEGYVVNPHTHGYDFETHVLTGMMTNVRFTRTSSETARLWATRPADWWRESLFFSPLRGDHRVEYKCETYLKPQYEHLPAGSSYWMTTDEIHTIELPSAEFTALLLVQYQDEPLPYTYFYDRGEKKPIISEGLYIPMTAEDVRARVQKVESLLGLNRVKIQPVDWITEAA